MYPALSLHLREKWINDQMIFLQERLMEKHISHNEVISWVVLEQNGFT